MDKGLVKGIALLLALCLLGGSFALADAPYSVQAGGDTAYIGTDSRVWLYSADKAVSRDAAVEIVHVYRADNAVCYLDAEDQLIYQPLDGSASRVLATGAVRPVALGDTVFYLDRETNTKISRVTPDKEARELAQGENGSGSLRVDDGKLFYLDSSAQAYQVDVATGEMTKAGQPIASDLRSLDGVLRVRDAGGQLHAITPASDDAEDAIRGAALMDGTLYYVVGGESMTLMAYDFDAAASTAIGALPAGFGGVLVAQDGKLFGMAFDPAKDGEPGTQADVVEIDPATAQTAQIGHFLVEDEAPVLASMPGALALYSSGEAAIKLLTTFPIGAGADAEATDASTLDAEEEEDGALDGDEPDEFLDDEGDEEAEAGAETAAPSAAPAATRKPDKTAGPSGYAELVRGDHGELVRNLQKRLVELGYLSGGVDGDFGYNTEQAVKAFQKKSKLEQDGVADIELQKKLFAKDAPKADVGYTALEKGDKGNAVKSIQARLKKLGYYAGPENGSFSNQLQTAVKLFQKTAGLKQTGKASVETQKKLFGSGAPKYSLSKLIALRPGDSGERVKRMQKRLKKLGYFTGEIGGNYQTLTTKAVKRFQKQIGEDADGVASVSLLTQIFADDAPEYEG